MNRGLATLVASLAMMDPDDVPPLPTERAGRLRFRNMAAVEIKGAEAKRARKAARRVEDRDKTAFGRDLARARRMQDSVEAGAWLEQRWVHVLERSL